MPDIHEISGIVPVEPIQPAVRALFDKVKDFQQRVRNSIGTAADRDLIYERLDCWLVDLKTLSLTAYEYKEQHDFYDLLCWNGFLNVQPLCPDSATPRQHFLFQNNLVLTAVRREIETFHLYASILLNRIPRIFPAYFGKDHSLGTKLTHEKFWKEYKRDAAKVPYITSELANEAAWLQKNMDWYRNRVITHPEGYEDDGFVFRGVKNNPKENLRLFLRKKGDESSDFRDFDHESATLEEIVPHLVAYVGGVIDILDQHADESVLMDPKRPRPERVRTSTASTE